MFGSHHLYHHYHNNNCYHCKHFCNSFCHIQWHDVDVGELLPVLAEVKYAEGTEYSMTGEEFVLILDRYTGPNLPLLIN